MLESQNSKILKSRLNVDVATEYNYNYNCRDHQNHNHNHLCGGQKRRIVSIYWINPNSIYIYIYVGTVYIIYIYIYLLIEVPPANSATGPGGREECEGRGVPGIVPGCLAGSGCVCI